MTVQYLSGARNRSQVCHQVRSVDKVSPGARDVMSFRTCLSMSLAEIPTFALTRILMYQLCKLPHLCPFNPFPIVSEVVNP